MAGIDHLALLALSYISINPNLLSSVKADKCSIYLSSVSALQMHMVSELYRRINTDSLHPVIVEQHQNLMYINCSLLADIVTNYLVSKMKYGSILYIN